ncbi:hypothetical protein ACFX2I_019595 [Malus domestica]
MRSMKRKMGMRRQVVLETGQKRHGSGQVGLGSEGVDEDREIDGFERWVCEQGGDGDVGCRVKVVQEADAQKEEVDLCEIFLG